ncbi:Alpha/beta hydrolase fold-1 [Xylariales sp. PMI_506]|nr:Alpha/beta hydrolase fold-1 [Xylariales sp. PMI_506]
MAPTLFLVPGLWEGPEAYAPLRSWLENSGFRVFTTSLLSTGTKYPGNPTMADDIAAIRSDLKAVVDAAGSEGVVAVLHSAGGFIGSNAMEGLTANLLEPQQKTGGVVKIIFITAGVAPEGSDQFGGPFIVDQDDGSCTCKDSTESLFHDLPAEEAEKWQATMSVQPVLHHWKTKVTYCGWRDVPSTYIICEEDRLLPIPVQEMMATAAGSKVVRLAAGHMAHLSATETLGQIIVEETTS